MLRSGRFPRHMRWQSSGGLAAALLGAETQGLAIDFTDLSMAVKDTGTPANSYDGDPNGRLTYSAPSTKYILNSSGVYVSGTTLRTSYSAAGAALGVLIEEARTNLFLNSRAPVTQSITTTAQSYTISGVGAVGATLTLSGSATGVLTGTAAKDRDKLTVTASAGTLTVTVAGTWDFVNVEAGAFATSPIVTAGATVTRAADNVNLATSSAPFSSVNGTSIYRYMPLVASIGLHDLITDISNDHAVYSDIGSMAAYITSGGVFQAAINTVNYNSIGAFNACGYAYTSGSQAIVLNGGAVASGAAATIPTLSGTYRIGYSRARFMNGYMKSVVYLPRKMTNTELQAATT